ncbi:thiamine pyrophosphate-binding protein [Vibrio parahaemolyticus]|nr:thiamine pyrophosphate-binding protein [Vibrio parahaemolyticus]
MTNSYTREKNAQILIALLKKKNISKIVASPGNTNISFIGSVQSDPFFTVYSCVDERSAAYMACGLAEESSEPIVISCTGATASRNYLPGLTEAYYRKLPILAVTSTQPVGRVGHHVAQVLDRSTIPNDVAKASYSLPIVKSKEDYWTCEIQVNNALLDLKHRGKGPVHIDLPTEFTLPFDVKNLPAVRNINRVTKHDVFPKLHGKIAVFVGSHEIWTEKYTEALDRFCAANNAVVFCDHSSGYKGKYRVLTSLLGFQSLMEKSSYKPDILIHIGEVTGDYSISSLIGKEVWRVSPDGILRDTFRKLTNIFDMDEVDFFEAYSNNEPLNNSYYEDVNSILINLRDSIPDLPFSNIWIASILSNELPKNSYLHLGILNTLRSWNFFEVDKSLTTSSNVGGFGIDGPISTTVGASLCNQNKLYYCILGDLAFFYDMNALGNRHIGKNIRILVINNGKGTEFKNYNHHAAYFNSTSDDFIAAANHFGNKSSLLVKNYVESLGFKYICADSKDTFLDKYKEFTRPEMTNKSIIFEVFTNDVLESNALEKMHHLVSEPKLRIKNNAKKILGKSGISVVKKVLNK